jgi:hypothetical protein
VQTTFVVFQSILLVMYLVQDTVKMPPLNNVPALVRKVGWAKVILATAIMSGLLALSLYWTVAYPAPPLPVALKAFYALWWGLQMYGMYVAWYRPYIFGPTAKELADYHEMHVRTHSFLPMRKGYPGPNTWHVGQNFFMAACAVLAFLRVAGVF